MKYEEIREALNDRGFTWMIAAQALGCTHQHVMSIAARRADSARVGKAIAALIEKPVLEVFPDKPRYAEDTRNIRQQSVDKARECLEQAGLVA